MLESTKIEQSMPLTVNRLLKGRFERFRSENTPVSTGGKLAPARDPALREPKAGVTIAKSVSRILPTTSCYGLELPTRHNELGPKTTNKDYRAIGILIFFP